MTFHAHLWHCRRQKSLSLLLVPHLPSLPAPARLVVLLISQKDYLPLHTQQAKGHGLRFTPTYPIRSTLPRAAPHPRDCQKPNLKSSKQAPIENRKLVPSTPRTGPKILNTQILLFQSYVKRVRALRMCLLPFDFPCPPILPAAKKKGRPV
jgi:hypothetical protein